MKPQQNHVFNLKLIPNTRIFFFKHNLLIVGLRGTSVYKKLLSYQNFSFVLSKSELTCYSVNTCLNNKNFLKLYNLLNTLMYSVNYFFSKKLILTGVGIRAWIKYSEKDQKSILLIKIGFSKDLYVPIPHNLLVFTLRPTLLLIRGLNKDIVSLFSSRLKQLRVPDLFKGKGIQYTNEHLILKPGKKS